MSALNQIMSRVLGGGRRRPTATGTTPGAGVGGGTRRGAAGASTDAAVGRGLRSLFRRVR